MRKDRIAREHGTATRQLRDRRSIGESTVSRKRRTEENAGWEWRFEADPRGTRSSGRPRSTEETSLCPEYTFHHLIIVHRLIIFLSLSAWHRAGHDNQPRFRRGNCGKKQEATSSFLCFFPFLLFLSFSPLPSLFLSVYLCLLLFLSAFRFCNGVRVIPLAVDKPMHPGRESPEERKKTEEKKRPDERTEETKKGIRR